MDYSCRLGSIHLLLLGVATADGRLARATVRPSGLLFFFDDHGTSSHFTFMLASSFLYLPHLNLTVPMRKCSGEHSCMSSTFNISILNET